MIPLAFNDFGFDHLPEAAPYPGVEGMIRAADDLGFKVFQHTMRGRKTAPTGELGVQQVDYFDVLDVDAIGALTEAKGITLNVHHHAYYPQPIAVHFIDRDEWYGDLKKVLRSAILFLETVGGRLVSIHPPQLKRAKSPTAAQYSLADRRKAIAAYDELIREVGDFAGEHGVLLGIEAICWGHPWIAGTVFRSPDEFSDFIEAPAMPQSVGLLVDTTHYHHKSVDVRPWLERWAPRLIDIHISDSVAHAWVDADHYLDVFLDEVHLPIGNGDDDLAGIVSTLKRIGYSGALTMELFPRNSHRIADITISRDRLAALVQSG